MNVYTHFRHEEADINMPYIFIPYISIHVCNAHVRVLESLSLITGKCLHNLEGHSGVVRCLHLNENTLVSGGDLRKLIVWDLKVH